jgi:hypothetical protein
LISNVRFIFCSCWWADRQYLHGNHQARPVGKQTQHCQRNDQRRR